MSIDDRIKDGSKCIMGPALIVIPDISGFTNYINNAELEHSRARIASLLEAILESNTIGLSVSEIEGDAILFYSFTNRSTPDEIINQCKLMYTRFHEKLRDFEASGCGCGSCKVLYSLTLKFIVHHGKLGCAMVKDYCKLYGKDLIIAHRLLKNSVPFREYLLFTDAFISHFNQDQVTESIEGLKLVRDVYSIQDIGEAGVNYVDLKPQLNKIDKNNDGNIFFYTLY